MRRLIALSLLLGLVAAAPAAARSYRIDVPKTLAKRIENARGKTVDILLPSRYTAERRKLYGFGGAIQGGGYAFSLGAVRGCRGAGACTVAAFSAEPAGTPAYKKRVRLANGIRGYYKGSSCGANCSDPDVQWMQDGVLYSVAAAVGGSRKVERRRAVRLANSAIKNGAR